MSPYTAFLRVYLSIPLGVVLLSFETGGLEPSGLHDKLSEPYEELMESGEGNYFDRVYIDAGHMGYDEEDREIPLPENRRLICRFFRGQFLFVAKQSSWNLTSATYDGRNAKMSLANISAAIEQAQGPLTVPIREKP